MMGRKTLKPRVLQATFVLILFATNIVRIIKVCVQPAVICVLDVESQVTVSETATSNEASGQRQNRVYTLHSRHDRESSPDAIIDTL